MLTLTDGVNDCELEFELLDTSIAHKWSKHLDLFIEAGQPWDDCRRFYNFPNSVYTKPVVVQRLRQLVDTIRRHDPGAIDRDIGDDVTQDDLNYLHHVFETCHGLYDQQHQNLFFMASPPAVQDALADLNIWIHRYETLGDMPRFVATWKYKPYRDLFQWEDFQHFSLYEQWGDLRINYCEIGKTLYDLWHDNDRYISAQAFQPHHHYCFDFTVRFTSLTQAQYADQEREIWRYFDQHQDFFNGLGYSRHDPRLCLGGITVAQLVQTQSRADIIALISRHQQFKSVILV